MKKQTIEEALKIIKAQYLFNTQHNIAFFTAFDTKIAALLDNAEKELDADDELLLDIKRTKKIIDDQIYRITS